MEYTDEQIENFLNKLGEDLCDFCDYEYDCPREVTRRVYRQPIYPYCINTDSLIEIVDLEQVKKAMREQAEQEENIVFLNLKIERTKGEKQ